GVYDEHFGSPELAPVFPAWSGPGWFAVVSFRSRPDRVVVSLFYSTASFLGTVTHLGLTASGFGFYVQGPGGTVYSQDARNPGGAAQALFFSGTGIHSGSWWMAFEGTPLPDSD